MWHYYDYRDYLLRLMDASDMEAPNSSERMELRGGVFGYWFIVDEFTTVLM